MRETYVGCKLIHAEPMLESEFSKTIKDIGFKDGTVPREGYAVFYPDGYISWSPKQTFDSAYRKVTEEEKALLRLDVSRLQSEVKNYAEMERELIRAGGEAWQQVNALKKELAEVDNKKFTPASQVPAIPTHLLKDNDKSY